MKNADTVVVLYFDYMDEREICMTLDASKTTNVSLTKPVFVKVYDYYDNCKWD
jgi:A-macroglobulin receptor binding domain